MLPNDPYLHLDAEARPDGPSRSETVSQFLALSLLGAREEAGMPSNHGGFDEDVNVYLVGLLARFLDSAFHDEASRYLHHSDLDLADAVRRGEDERLTFRLYKTNADHLLLGVGLFNHVEASGTASVQLFRRDPDEFIGRGSTYYQLASSSLRRLRRRASGQEEALNKLGEGFSDYVVILRRLRTTYFHLTSKLGEGTLYHLSRAAGGAADRQALFDRFLDAYSSWRDEASEASYAALEEAVDVLRRADPEFAFQLPDPPADGGVIQPG